MTNMSYCRFQNTLSDLKDCVDALENESERPDRDQIEERNAAKRMRTLCEEYIEIYDSCYE